MPLLVVLMGFGPFTGEEGKEGKLPLHVTSDRMEANYGEGVVTFLGNVVAKRGDFVLTSRTLKVFLRKEGEEIEKIVAEEDVKISKGERKAACQKATYYYNEGKVVLEGNPIVWQGDNRLRGWRIVFFVNENRALAERKGNERVRVTIVQTEERKGAGK